MLMRMLVDGHLDLAWNGASHDRDLTLPLSELNRVEAEMTDVPYRGRATTTFPEMRSGGIRLCLATLLARSGPAHARRSQYLRTDLDSATRMGSYAAAYAQLACYRLWEQQSQVNMIHTQAQLETHLQRVQSAEADSAPIGIILTMEGADPIVHPNQLPEWYAAGLRAIGPAHYGHSHYAGGTAVDGPLTDDGRQLLDGMRQLNMGLDLTHLCDRAMVEALERFTGTVWASHHNSRTLVPNDRQLTDDQMKQIIARDGVIGAACDAWMLQPGWVIGRTTSDELTLTSVARQIDYVCQLAGNAQHAAIGSDLDGGFGTEQTPSDLRTIADLQKLGELLAADGYTDEDITRIFSGNWLRMFRQILPKEEPAAAD